MDLSNPLNLIIAGIYFLAVGILTLFSAFSVYILIRYGKSQITALGVSVLYSVIFLSILFSSYRTLLNITQ